MLKRILALLLIGVLLVLPVASADDSGTTGHNPENDLQFTQFPQVYVNVTNNASFNVSYVGLILLTGSGVYYSYFPSQHWVVKRNSNNSVAYDSRIMFSHLDSEHIGLISQKFNITNLQAQNPNGEGDQPELENIQANVSISMDKVNITSPLNNTNASSNLTGFKLSFTLTSSQITGPGDLLLIQQLGAKINHGFERYHDLAQISHNLSRLNGSAIGVTGTNYDAYFWWDPSYMLNGHSANLTASRSIAGNTDTLVFKFQFKNGLNSIIEDPYFSIPQINLFKNPILQKDIQNAAAFIILHIELFTAGIATGAALIGFTYASYRRKRF